MLLQPACPLLSMLGEVLPVFSEAALLVFRAKRESARSVAEPWFSFLSRHPQLSFADVFYRSAKRFPASSGGSQWVLRPVSLEEHGPAFSHAQARAPVSGALLPSLSKPYPWPGQAYGAWQRVCGLQVFLPLVSILLPFQKITHGSSPLSRARFLFRILFVDGVVNFTRLCFVHAENLYQILNVRRV